MARTGAYVVSASDQLVVQARSVSRPAAAMCQRRPACNLAAFAAGQSLIETRNGSRLALCRYVATAKRWTCRVRTGSGKLDLRT